MNYASIDKLTTRAEKNPLDIVGAKENGQKVFGFYCLYSPVEIALAAGGVAVTLCGTRNDPIPAAEKTLPRNLCPLIKSSFGFAIEDSCPYFKAADLIVADSTCDGKKKMFEQMAEIKPLHLMYLPHNQELDVTGPFWEGEVVRFKERVEQECGIEITDDMLREAIQLTNRESTALKGLMDLNQQSPAPISGMKMLEIVFKAGFFASKQESIEHLEAIIEEVSSAPKEEIKQGPRVISSGVPMGLGSHKVCQLIEDAGGVVVAFENCTGYKKTMTVDTNKAPITALAEKYLATPCSIMSPNPGRIELLNTMITDFAADAVLDLTWQACHTYNVEAETIRKFVQGEKDMPYLHIETDYSDADTEQLRVRIEAFLEMIG